jgi:hypothetical protein
MIKNFLVLSILFFLCGCQTLPHKTKATALPSQQTVQKTEEASPAPQPSEPPQEELPPQGMIVAKTEFEGVIKKSFIRLTIVDQNDRAKVYQLYIGDKSRQLDFWNTETIEPGYFFVQLPAGSYSIASLSIPVGSSLASELMNITFEVRPERAVYIGTLNVVGTKEKIKLGGIPVIKPGFDYTVKISDEYNEAFKEFKQRFPENSENLEVHLMKDLTQQKWSQENSAAPQSRQNL